MDRGSDKHSARMDEALKGEVRGLVTGNLVEPRAEEWRQAEPSGEDQPDVDRAPDATLIGGTPDGMTEADVEGRSELARYVRRASFPGDREALLADARDLEAPDSVLAELERLPGGQQFANVQEVWTTLGNGVEVHRS